MQKLFQGVHDFQSHVFNKKQELFHRLAGGQQPLALFITCSDSRIDPNLLTQTEPGDLFILRNAGNIVPPYDADCGGEAATIEYAVRVLHVRDIVVCGHSHCGAMAGLLAESKDDQLPAVNSWLSHAERARDSVQQKHANIHDESSRLLHAVEENVLVQLEHLRTHPSVATALDRKELNLHGWVYKFETGDVSCCEANTEEFVPLQSSQHVV